MVNGIQRKSERSPEEAAKLKSLRERYQREKPSISDLESAGAEFVTLGEVIFLRTIARDLKQERKRQNVSVEELAERVDLTADELDTIESGTVAALTFGVLCRIADAMGMRVVGTLVESAA